MRGLSIEETIKQQFTRQFRSADWRLFKRMAEFYFRVAAFLRTRDVDMDEDLKLLARNCQKRLFIGIGVELLLKAAYLNRGYSINVARNAKADGLAFPFLVQDVDATKVHDDKTYTLNNLIAGLDTVLPLDMPETILRGLRIAKVFRNKEGHVVLPRHKFDPSNYRDIESALTHLYRNLFEEDLRVRFSLEPNEDGEWRIL